MLYQAEPLPDGNAGGNKEGHPPRDLLLDGLDHYNIATKDGSLRLPDPSFALHLITDCDRTGEALTLVDANAI